MADFRRIMVAISNPVDDGPVIEVATALARRLEAELLILHVNDAMAIVPGSDIATELAIEDTAFLDRLVDRLTDEGLLARGLLRPGIPGEDIPEIAASEGVDMLVVGSNARSPLAAALLGTVDQEVLHGARCPVLMVPEVDAR